MRNTNSVRISGIIATSDGVSANGGSLSILNKVSKTIPYKVYTFGYKVTDNLGTLNRYGVHGSAGANTYHQKEHKKYFLTIFYDTASSLHGLLVYPKAGKYVPFDFTISDVFMYEGAYVNPPVYVSPDVNPCIKFIASPLLDSVLEREGIESSITANNRWYRVYKFPKFYPAAEIAGVVSNSISFWGRFIINKGYNTNVFHQYYIDVALSIMDLGHTPLPTGAYRLEVKVDKPTTGTTNNLSKFKIVKDSDNECYLLAYYVKSGTGDTFDTYLVDYNAGSFVNPMSKHGSLFYTDNKSNKEIREIYLDGILHFAGGLYLDTGVNLTPEVTPTWNMTAIS